MGKEIAPVCPICGGEVVMKEVEKILRRGEDVLILQVEAGVCTHCGERIYDLETREWFERLRREEVIPLPYHLRRVGYAYEVVLA
jgi:YgiT-type zinc finger domain-containing protein